MISICIPVYDFDVEPLVSILIAQIESSNSMIEICIVDDGSADVYRMRNRGLATMDFVRYEELPVNVGRSAIRNYLAQKAIYPYLVFLDCDVMVNDSFIINYINSLNGVDVLSGGVSYPDSTPSDKQLLHWKNGVKREVHSVSQRNIHPYRSFLSCNFLISKQLFESIHFNEQITEYGYEDVILGIELSNKKVHVEHIDNPVVHLGIEDTDVFIGKIEKSICTLSLLPSIIDEKWLLHYIKLYRIYNYLPWVVKSIVGLMFRLFRQMMRWQLKSKNPSLIVFDCYKLGYLCHQMNR